MIEGRLQLALKEASDPIPKDRLHELMAEAAASGQDAPVESAPERPRADRWDEEHKLLSEQIRLAIEEFLDFLPQQQPVEVARPSGPLKAETVATFAELEVDAALRFGVPPGAGVHRVAEGQGSAAGPAANDDDVILLRHDVSP